MQNMLYMNLNLPVMQNMLYMNLNMVVLQNVLYRNIPNIVLKNELKNAYGGVCHPLTTGWAGHVPANM